MVGPAQESPRLVPQSAKTARNTDRRAVTTGITSTAMAALKRVRLNLIGVVVGHLDRKAPAQIHVEMAINSAQRLVTMATQMLETAAPHRVLSSSTGHAQPLLRELRVPVMAYVETEKSEETRRAMTRTLPMETDALVLAS